MALLATAHVGMDWPSSVQSKAVPQSSFIGLPSAVSRNPTRARDGGHRPIAQTAIDNDQPLTPQTAEPGRSNPVASTGLQA